MITNEWTLQIWEIHTLIVNQPLIYYEENPKIKIFIQLMSAVNHLVACATRIFSRPCIANHLHFLNCTDYVT